jgi:hypothetical protein
MISFRFLYLTQESELPRDLRGTWQLFILLPELVGVAGPSAGGGRAGLSAGGGRAGCVFPRGPFLLGSRGGVGGGRPQSWDLQHLVYTWVRGVSGVLIYVCTCVCLQEITDQSPGERLPALSRNGRSC